MGKWFSVERAIKVKEVAAMIAIIRECPVSMKESCLTAVSCVTK